MHIKFFNHLYSRARSAIEAEGNGWEIEAYRHHKKTWHPTPTLSVAKDLDNVRRTEKSVRSGQQYLIYDKHLDSMFVIASPKRTRQARLDEVEKNIRERLLAAEHEFEAHHDKLTHLLNRSGFEKAATGILKKRPKQKAGDVSSLAPPGNSICFIALDIDHFKHVNDSYGHQYGDAVLLAFAWRISEHLESLEKEGKFEAIIGRPGGEEFEILVSNLSGEDEAKTLAESFREAIHNDLIPSDSQWPVIVQDQSLDGLSLPVERRITASIGYTFRSNNDGLDVSKTYSLLRAEADAAVYRAKADGRDCVRNYSQIAREHGRVLEHLSDAHIVAIDIGQSVGVRRGHVFDVYLPTLAGGSPYLQKSDRGSKTLGAYPKVTAGRVQVFDAQKEISFCSVVDLSVTGHFPVGSRLCYVPYGNDAPLVGTPRTHHSPAGLSPAQMAARIDALPETETRALCLFALEKASEEKNPGQDEARLEGRHLLVFLRTLLPPRTEFSVMDEDTIGALITAPLSPSELLTSLLKCVELVADSPRLLAIGAIHTDSLPRGELAPVGAETVSRKDGAELVYLARVALFVARHASSKPAEAGSLTTEVFDDETPARALSTWRRLRKYDEAVVDYVRLRELGFTGTTFDNQGGLALFESKDDREATAAVNALESALEMADPAYQSVIRANLGLALAKAGKYEKAFQCFKQSRDFLQRSGKPLSWLYTISHAKSAVEAYKVDRTNIARTTLARLIDKALKTARPSKKIYVAWRAELEVIQKSGQVIQRAGA